MVYDIRCLVCVLPAVHINNASSRSYTAPRAKKIEMSTFIERNIDGTAVALNCKSVAPCVWVCLRVCEFPDSCYLVHGVIRLRQTRNLIFIRNLQQETVKPVVSNFEQL